MPIYEYRCGDCGAVFEVFQKFSDDPIEVCEKCSGPVTKVLHPAAIHFKGSGFYTTDYGRGKKGSRSGAGAEAGDAAAAGDGGDKSDKSDKSGKGEKSDKGGTASKRETSRGAAERAAGAAAKAKRTST